MDKTPDIFVFKKAIAEKCMDYWIYSNMTKNS